jgi:hypothetical protein
MQAQDTTAPTTSVVKLIGPGLLVAAAGIGAGDIVSSTMFPHGVELAGAELFYTHVHLHGGPASVRRYLPEPIQLVRNGTINPGKVIISRHGSLRPLRRRRS